MKQEKEANMKKAAGHLTIQPTRQSFSPHILSVCKRSMYQYTLDSQKNEDTVWSLICLAPLSVSQRVIVDSLSAVDSLEAAHYINISINFHNNTTLFVKHFSNTGTKCFTEQMNRYSNKMKTHNQNGKKANRKTNMLYWVKGETVKPLNTV